MTTLRINTLLWTGAFVLFALAGALIAWAVVVPLSVEPMPQPRALLPTTNPTSSANLPSFPDLQAALDKPLRKNLTGSSPTIDATTASANSTNPGVTLVGTIGNSLAMLKTPDGKIELKAVGETVAGVTVVGIAPSRVEIRYNGKLMSLDKQRRG